MFLFSYYSIFHSSYLHIFHQFSMFTLLFFVSTFFMLNTENSSRNILKTFYSWEVTLKGCQWLVLMKANKMKFSEYFFHICNGHCFVFHSLHFLIFQKNLFYADFICVCLWVNQRSNLITRQDCPRFSLHTPPHPQVKWQATPRILCGSQIIVALWRHLQDIRKASDAGIVHQDNMTAKLDHGLS